MKFNDTSTKQGIIQDCEFWTNLGDGAISGDAILLPIFTRLVNLRYSSTLAKIQLLSGVDGAEDRNYADQQFSTFPLAAGTNDYEFLTDGSGNTISDITGVHILPSATATEYVPLDRLLLSDKDAQLVMSPNSSATGTPTGFIEKGSVVYFDKIPDYTATGKLFYRLVPSYFTSSDTTKTAGFAEPYHRILSLGASLDYLLVHKPDNQMAISRLEGKLAVAEEDLESFTRMKNPTRAVLRPAQQSSR